MPEYIDTTRQYMDSTFTDEGAIDWHALGVAYGTWDRHLDNKEPAYKAVSVYDNLGHPMSRAIRLKHLKERWLYIQPLRKEIDGPPRHEQQNAFVSAYRKAYDGILDVLDLVSEVA